MNISDQSGLRRALILASVLAAGGARAAGAIPHEEVSVMFTYLAPGASRDI